MLMEFFSVFKSNLPQSRVQVKENPSAFSVNAFCPVSRASGSLKTPDGVSMRESPLDSMATFPCVAFWF